jgi:DNA polymerase-3 subunit epsilon
VHVEALAVHGISNADLADKPIFDDIVAEFMAFIDGAHLVAHNATFDINFINAEFARLGHAAIGPERVVDTLLIARRKHPMGPNSLDALCRRYGIDNTRRTKHGALLDSELLSEVYIELIGGKQAALGLEVAERITVEETQVEVSVKAVAVRPAPLPSRLSEAERAAHRALVEGLGDAAIWARTALE